MNKSQSGCTGRNTLADTAQKGTEDHAGVHFPPPLIHVAALLCAMGINEFFPLLLPQPELLWWLGPCLFLLALILAVLSFREFFRARNRPPPNQPIRELMTSGPYRITRNPLYLSLALIHGGIGCFAGVAWVLLSLLPTLLVIRYYVIAREEAYLIRRFGDRYLDYQARVRRWF